MLQNMLDNIGRPDTVVGQIFVGLIVALIVTAIVALIAKSRKVASQWLSKNVHQITSSHDEKIHSIEELQRVFPPEERDPTGVLSDCIRASKYKDGMPQSDVAQIVLYYENEGHIHGYLSAEYFIQERTIFLWYLVNLRTISDSTVLKWPKPQELSAEELEHRARERDSAVVLFRELRQSRYDDNVSQFLLRELSATCERIKGPWAHVIAEVDARRGRDAAGKLRVFQGYLSKILSPPWWRKVLSKLPWIGREIAQPERVFAVGTPYKMPLHDPELLNGRTQAEIKKFETAAWLIYAPRPSGTQMSALARQDVFLFFDVLAMSYKKADHTYDAYIDAFFQDLKTKVPEKPTLLEAIEEGMSTRRAGSSSPSAATSP